MTQPAPIKQKIIEVSGFVDRVWARWFETISTEVGEFTDLSDAVDLNTTHRTSDGTDHSDVVLNNTHRVSDGTDHTYIDQDVTITASPTFANLTVSDTLTVDGKDAMKWAVLQGG